jgi:hypothetical protein
MTGALSSIEFNHPFLCPPTDRSARPGSSRTRRCCREPVDSAAMPSGMLRRPEASMLLRASARRLTSTVAAMSPDDCHVGGRRTGVKPRPTVAVIWITVVNTMPIHVWQTFVSTDETTGMLHRHHTSDRRQSTAACCGCTATTAALIRRVKRRVPVVVLANSASLAAVAPVSLAVARQVLPGIR